MIGGDIPIWLVVSIMSHVHPYEGWRYFISGLYRRNSTWNLTITFQSHFEQVIYIYISNLECVKHHLLGESHLWLSDDAKHINVVGQNWQ